MRDCENQRTQDAPYQPNSFKELGEALEITKPERPNTLQSFFTKAFAAGEQPIQGENEMSENQTENVIEVSNEAMAKFMTECENDCGVVLPESQISAIKERTPDEELVFRGFLDLNGFTVTALNACVAVLNCEATWEDLGMGITQLFNNVGYYFPKRYISALGTQTIPPGIPHAVSSNMPEDGKVTMVILEDLLFKIHKKVRVEAMDSCLERLKNVSRKIALNRISAMVKSVGVVAVVANVISKEGLDNIAMWDDIKKCSQLSTAIVDEHYKVADAEKRHLHMVASLCRDLVSIREKLA